MTTRARLWIAVAAAIMTSMLTAAAASASSPATSSPATSPATEGLVRVDTGWLRGDVAADHVRYSAIPFAAPPVGDRRWQPPARPENWPGVRDATNPSPLCPQGGWGTVLGQEDCLFLDVTVPRGVDQDDRLPVMVWLHGGGLNSGGARRFDSARFATEGEMIVVTANYRLGALGFLITPELGSGGNYGLMDQAAALRWVRHNVAAFGGDPRNVTLAGQSGGARSICAHLAAPTSRGLFDRAIIQSGACDATVPTRAEALRFGAQAVNDLECAEVDDVAACLRQSTVADLVGTLGGIGYGLTDRSGDRPWNPVAGTRMLPWQPADALRRGAAARVPLLVGGNRDEMRGFVYGREPDLTVDGYRSMVSDALGADADAVLARYPAADYHSPAVALATVLGDWGGQIGACPVLRTAEAASPHQPVYVYEFAEDAGPMPDGFPMGAYHGWELPFLWTLVGDDATYPPLTPAQDQLSATMIDYWSSFVRDGDPNGPGRPSWPEFGVDGTVVSLSTDGIGPTPFGASHQCDFWAGISG